MELRRGKARNMGTCPTRPSEAVDNVFIASITGSPHALANSARTVAELVPADRYGRHDFVSSMRIRHPLDRLTRRPSVLRTAMLDDKP